MQHKRQMSRQLIISMYSTNWRQANVPGTLPFWINITFIRFIPPYNTEPHFLYNKCNQENPLRTTEWYLVFFWGKYLKFVFYGMNIIFTKKANAPGAITGLLYNRPTNCSFVCYGMLLKGKISREEGFLGGTFFFIENGAWYSFGGSI